jgi:tetratricopeptide (TPR) repeat protein
MFYHRQFAQRPSRPNRLAGRRLVSLALALPLVTALVQTGHAQLDASGLIGYAVADFDAQKYREIDDAIARFRNGDVDGAMGLIEIARQKNPDLPPADVLMARLHFAANQLVQGRNSLERAVRDAAQDPEAYLLLGDLSLKAGGLTAGDLLFAQVADRIQSFQGSEKRKRFCQIGALNGRATVAEQREDWPAAEKYLADWVKIDPDNAAALQRLGRAWLMQDKVDQARKALAAAKQKDAKLPPADVTMARLYQQRGKPEEARKAFDQAIAANANDAGARLAYVQWLLETEQAAKVQPHIDAALKAEPNSRDALLLAGVAARINKNLPAAQSFLEKAHLLAPSNAAILNQLAQVLIEQKDQEKLALGAQYAAIAAAQEPQSGDAGVTLGWALYESNRAREAEQKLQDAAKTGNVGADGRYLMAKIYYDRGQNEQAAQLLESALKVPGLFVYRDQARTLLERIRQ